jgi:hypothetical protein
VLVVLSGDNGTRRAYRWDSGASPSVAIDSDGRVVELHDSGSGWLWFWTGQYEADGRIRWERHGRFDRGQTPAVDINDGGWVVEVHKSQSRARLFSRVGQLRNDLEVNWFDSHDYDDGTLPTVRFSGPDSLSVLEIHQVDGRTVQRRGTIDPDRRMVVWEGSSVSPRPLWNKALAARAGRQVEVMLGADGGAPAGTLLYTTADDVAGRIAYAQVMFTERQRADVLGLERDGLRFSAAHAADDSWLADQRAAGRIVRAWAFDTEHRIGQPPWHFPATDHPGADWYRAICREHNCAE